MAYFGFTVFLANFCTLKTSRLGLRRAGLHADGFRSPPVRGLLALGHWFPGMFVGKVLLAALNTVVSLAIFTLLFAAIYKVLPDTAIPWRDLALEQEQFKGA